MRFTPITVCTAAALVLSPVLTRRETRTTASTVVASPNEDTQYKNRSAHFTIQYPSDWCSRPTKEFTLLLEHESTADAARVTVDVPHIPPHLPGMVTMKLVVNGYLDDLKERLSDFGVVERYGDNLAGAAAQRLVVRGRERSGGRRGEERMIVALVAIRNEQVYIVQADATPELLGTARVPLSRIVSTWDWTK